jgi:hypothetical protein
MGSSKFALSILCYCYEYYRSGGGDKRVASCQLNQMVKQT